VPPGTYAAIVHAGADVPETWKTLQEFEVVQMIGEHVNGVDASEAIPLGAHDVPDMLELVRQTDPGPFVDRTIELGDYVGIRRDSKLVAMAGERLHFDGWTEISAVCTAPAHRGHGMASRLVGALIAGIQRRSERTFLHVLTTNTNAIRLYEELGFRVRRRLTISVLTPELIPSQET
jgi:predicted GNAT family acetyltransferase